MSSAGTQSFNVATPSLADVGDFFRGPRKHLDLKYPNMNTHLLLFLILSSLFLFVWEIVVLATVNGAIAWIAIGQVYSALLAMSDFADVYVQISFYLVWLVDLVFALITLGRAVVPERQGDGFAFALFATILWVVLDVGQIVCSLLLLRKKRGSGGGLSRQRNQTEI